MLKRIVSLFFICIYTISFQNLFAFGSSTHTLLTDIAVKRSELGDKLGKSWKDKLIQYSRLPDERTSSGSGTLFKSHFFDPNFDTFQFYIDEYIPFTNVPINAFVATKIHFRDAINNYLNLKKNDKGEYVWFEDLGKAIHYAQDICCLAHQQTWMNNLMGAILYKHTDYENCVDLKLKNVKQRLETESFSFEFPKYSKRLFSDDKYFSYAYCISVHIVQRALNLNKNCFNTQYKCDGYRTCFILDEVLVAFKVTCELINAFYCTTMSPN